MFRIDETNRLASEYAQLRDTGAGYDDFLDLLQLNQVGVSNPGANMSPLNGKMRPQVEIPIDENGNPVNDNYQGIRFFNELNNINTPEKTNLDQLKNWLDISQLEKKAANREQVVNQQDIDLLNNLALLSGGTNNYSLSNFIGQQVGESTLDDALRARNDKFQNEDLKTVHYGGGAGQEDRYARNWYGGWEKAGEESAHSQAYGTLDDILNQGQIHRRVTSDAAGSGSVWNDPTKLPVQIPGQIIAPSPMQSDISDGDLE